MILGLVLLAELQTQEPTELVVHEWGTFTTVSGAEGASLEWRPLSGGDDLPRFVYGTGGTPRGLRHGQTCKGCSHFGCGCGEACSPDSRGNCNKCKTCYVATVRMETPILYFYADRETTVSVKVGFPQGKVTEWYPQARSVGSGIDWGGVRVLPQARPEFPLEKGESHYYPARETDSAPVRVCGNEGVQHEKFLFYRGAGTFELPIRASLEGGKTKISSTEEISWVVLFDNARGSVGYRILRKVVGEVRSDVAEKCGAVEQLGEELVRLLIGDGLFEKEARAMVKTWRDSWFEEGKRLFYVVPRRITDAVLPLEIEPKPAKVTRVLVGRLEILTPEMEKEIRALVERLGDRSIESRDAASRALKKYGRFAEPLLRRVLRSTEDAELQTRIRKLLEQE